MKTLQELCNTNALMKTYMETESGYGTDKGDCHGYIEAYGELLKNLQHKPVTICEVGVAGGGSIYLWDRYFTHPDTVIYGVDVQFPHGHNSWKQLKSLFTPRVKFLEVDINSINSTVLSSMKFDFVLDDGSHNLVDQVAFVRFFLPKMNSKGILMIEDVLPDDWNDNKIPHKSNTIDNINVARLVAELPHASFIDNRRKPRYLEWNGGGFYSEASIVVVYEKDK